MAIFINDVQVEPSLSRPKKPVKITVFITEKPSEPRMYRLPFKLGEEKGGIKE